MKRALGDVRFWFGGIVIVATLAAALFGPALAPTDPYAMSGSTRFAAPGEGGFLLGGDMYGRDILSRLLYGARLSVIVSVLSVTIATVSGTALGMVAAYFGGRVDMIIMRFIDVLIAFPSIILIIFVVTFLSSALPVLIVTIGVLFIPRFARVMYGMTLAAREVEYVEAYRALGSRHWRILLRGILPNVFAPVLVQTTLSLGDAILLESGLSFLGLGPPPPAIAWGRMVAEAGPFMHLSVYGLLWPAAVISLAVLAFNVFGDAVRDLVDKRRA